MTNDNLYKNGITIKLSENRFITNTVRYKVGSNFVYIPVGIDHFIDGSVASHLLTNQSFLSGISKGAISLLDSNYQDGTSYDDSEGDDNACLYEGDDDDYDEDEDDLEEDLV